MATFLLVLFQYLEVYEESTSLLATLEYSSSRKPLKVYSMKLFSKDFPHQRAYYTCQVWVSSPLVMSTVNLCASQLSNKTRK